MTLLLSDFKADGVTIDANGNITAANPWGSLVLEFDEYPDVNKIESITVNTTGFTPSTFFDFYGAKGTKETAWSLNDAKGMNLTTWYKFGLGYGGENGLTNVNYQLNSVVFKYTTPTNTLSVT